MSNLFRRWITLFAAALTGLTLFVAVAPAHAEDPKDTKSFTNILQNGAKSAAPDALKPDSGATDNPMIIVGRLIGSVIEFLGAVLLLMLLYGGFKWMTAQGDPKAVQAATGIIRDAIIGLVIIGSSYALSNYIIGRIGAAVTGK